MQEIEVIDSHTGGEPTRVVVSGGPQLGTGPLAQRLEVLREYHDGLRRAVILEPRGSDVLVGALLCEPSKREAAAGVIFFNNAGYLGMCGHGTIGLVETLAYLGRIGPGEHLLETPVGDVTAVLHENGRVSVRNVPAYRHLKGITVDLGDRQVSGDVAWGGNWFFLCEDHGLDIDAGNLDELTEISWRIRETLAGNGVTGAGGALIDHVELFGPSEVAHSRNFVLCPGKAYDRSPCGTGTSAKLACLEAEGKLAPGEIWRQESIIGSVFEGSYQRLDGGRISPTITGEAFITAHARLLLDDSDPFRLGIG